MMPLTGSVLEREHTLGGTSTDTAVYLHVNGTSCNSLGS